MPPDGEPTEHDLIQRLTARECEVALLLADGKSRAQIATAIFKSPKTVDCHRAAIRGKAEIWDGDMKARLIAFCARNRHTIVARLTFATNDKCCTSIVSGSH